MIYFYFLYITRTFSRNKKIMRIILCIKKFGYSWLYNLIIIFNNIVLYCSLKKTGDRYIYCVWNSRWSFFYVTSLRAKIFFFVRLPCNLLNLITTSSRYFSSTFIDTRRDVLSINFLVDSFNGISKFCQSRNESCDKIFKLRRIIVQEYGEYMEVTG